VLLIAALTRNVPESDKGRLHGEYAVVCDRAKSLDLGKLFAAEALLRAVTFETGRTIKYGASIGQSLQTLRLFGESDELVLNRALDTLSAQEAGCRNMPGGLWTKCDAVFADYFLKNWKSRREPLAFLLYDPPPVMPSGLPVFVHSDKNLRMVARFLEGQFVAGHKHTVEKDERVAERERVWLRYRAKTIDPPAKDDFDKFWDGQNGVRALFVMDEVTELSDPVPFKVYGRALGVGISDGRWLSLFECGAERSSSPNGWIACFAGPTVPWGHYQSDGVARASNQHPANPPDSRCSGCASPAPSPVFPPLRSERPP
jgi:hypothetical protein